jgi:hypothetical protein
MNATLSTWLSDLIAPVGGRVSGSGGQSAVLFFPPGESLVFIEGDNGIKEWASGGRYGEFEPALTPENYTPALAMAAIDKARAEARRGKD